MAQLPDKLIDRLNVMIPEIGDYKLGTLLQNCLDQIAATTGGGSIKLPLFPSTVTFENSNTVGEGCIFVNSSTKTINYYACGVWHEIDIPSLQAQITANATCCAMNAADILNLTSQILSLTTAFNAHNHDGTNSQLINIKGQLVTGAPQGHFLYANGGVVDCMAIDPTFDTFLDGVLFEDNTTGLDFDSSCFTITNTAGVIDITIPDLKQALIDISVNTACCAANASAIAALNLAITNLTINVQQNSTNIANYYAEFLAHDHSGGVNGPCLDPIVAICSPDGAGNVPLNWVLGADGLGNTIWINPTTIQAPVTICGKNKGGATAQDVFIQIDPVDDCFEFRKIDGGCGIVTSIDPVDDDITIDIDFAGMTDIGTAVDPTADYVLIHDVSTGECVKTSVQTLLSSGGDTLVAGKGITLTPTANPNESEVALDLSAVTTVGTVATLDTAADYVLVYDDSAGDCVRLSLDEFVSPDYSIDDLTDVDTTTTPPDVDQTLCWDGTNWVPQDKFIACPDPGYENFYENIGATNSHDTGTTANLIRGHYFESPATATVADLFCIKITQNSNPIGNIVAHVYDDNAGQPGTIVATSDPVDIATVPVENTPTGSSSQGFTYFVFPTPPTLNPSVRYHFVLDFTGLTQDGNVSFYRFPGDTTGGRSVSTDGGATWNSWGGGDNCVMVASAANTLTDPVDCDILKYNETLGKWTFGQPSVNPNPNLIDLPDVCPGSSPTILLDGLNTPTGTNTLPQPGPLIRGMCMTSPNTGDLTDLQIKITQNSTTTGNIVIDFWDDAGGQPGTLLGSSAGIDVNSFPAGVAPAGLTSFNFASPIPLVSGTTYYWTINTTGLVDQTNTHILTHVAAAGNPDVVGLFSADGGTTWGTSESLEICFQALGTAAALAPQDCDTLKFNGTLQKWESAPHQLLKHWGYDSFPDTGRVIPHNTTFQIRWPGIQYESVPGVMDSTGTFTVPPNCEGCYSIEWSVGYSYATGADHEMDFIAQLFRNGIAIDRGDWHRWDSKESGGVVRTHTEQRTGTANIELAAGDTIHIAAYQGNSLATTMSQYGSWIITHLRIIYHGRTEV